MISLLGCSSSPGADVGPEPVDAAASSPDAGAEDVQRVTDAGEAQDTGEPDAGTRDTGARATFEWESIAPEPIEVTGRWGMQIADRRDGTALIFGGTNSGGASGSVLGDAWLLDARGDAPVFTRVEIDAGAEAPPRYCGCLAWDPDAQRALMVGGRDALFQESRPETWILDMDGRRWTRSAAPSTPPGVIGCSMLYSSSRHAMYLFGGASRSTGFSGQTWRYDFAAATWTLLPATGPLGRYDAIMSCLGPTCERFVLFAGAGVVGNRPRSFSDVWTFDPSSESWTEVPAEGAGPDGRRMPFVIVQPDGAALIAGMGVRNLDGSGPYSDLWRFDLGSRRWEAIALGATAPSARGFAMALPGGPGAAGLLLGGFDGSGPLEELWRLWPPSDGTWR